MKRIALVFFGILWLYPAVAQLAKKLNSTPGFSLNDVPSKPEHGIYGLDEGLNFNPSSKSTNWKWDTICTFGEYNENLSQYIQSFDVMARLSEFTYKEWLGGNWTDKYRWLYSYYVTGDDKESVSQHKQGSIWVNYQRTNFNYDIDGRPLEILTESWDNNAWIPESKQLHAYQVNGQLDTMTSYIYDNHAWQASYRITLDFDSAGNQVLWQFENWENATWVMTSREIRVYNPHNKISLKSTQFFQNGNLDHESRTVYVYDTNQKLLTETYQINTSNVWVNHYRIQYVYGPTGLVSNEIMEDWVYLDSLFRKNSQMVYDYDNGGNLILSLQQFYNHQSSTWHNYERLQYAYDGEDNSISGQSESWNNGWTPKNTGMLVAYSSKSIVFSIRSSGIFKPFSRYEAHYNEVTAGMSSFQEVEPLLRFFPNPASGYVSIVNQGEAITQISLTDIHGRVMGTWANLDCGASLQISLESLLPGLYIIQASSWNRNSKGKLIVK